jgi:hypothetical protein
MTKAQKLNGLRPRKEVTAVLSWFLLHPLMWCRLEELRLPYSKRSDGYIHGEA